MHTLKSLFFTIFITSFAMESRDLRPLKRVKSEELIEQIDSMEIEDSFEYQEQEFYCKTCQSYIPIRDAQSVERHLQKHSSLFNQRSSGMHIKQLIFGCHYYPW